MPSRNVYKIDVAESYYHVYARGSSKQKVFLDAQDYRYFLALFDRYLSAKPAAGKTGVAYPHYRGSVEVLAYCLMQNHFHILLYQIEQGAMKRLMHSIMTSYSRYFNLKYKRSGAVFESRYKASAVDRDAYLLHVSRYVHLNPRFWQTYRYSSIGYYIDTRPEVPAWLTIQRVLEFFDGPDDYRTFVSDYEESMRMLDELKHQLADQ